MPWPLTTRVSQVHRSEALCSGTLIPSTTSRATRSAKVILLRGNWTRSLAIRRSQHQSEDACLTLRSSFGPIILPIVIQGNVLCQSLQRCLGALESSLWTVVAGIQSRLPSSASDSLLHFMFLVCDVERPQPSLCNVSYRRPKKSKGLGPQAPNLASCGQLLPSFQLAVILHSYVSRKVRWDRMPYRS